METLHRITMAIMTGQIECGVAMGVERMGRSIGGGGEKPNRITATTQKIDQLNDVQLAPAPDHDDYFSVEFPDYIRRSPWIQSMVQTAQNVAECYGLTREELDQCAVDSHARGAAALRAPLAPTATRKPEAVANRRTENHWLKALSAPM